MSVAVQSATINSIIDAVGTILLNGDGQVPGTGINVSYIQEAYNDYRPRSAEPYEITYGIMEEAPYPYAGAGRLGHSSYLNLEVTLYTRLQLDPAGSDYQWSSNLASGALVMRLKIQDILQDKFLFSSYDPVTFFPNGTPLTIEGLQQLPSPRPIKPSTGQSDKGRDVGGYGQHKLVFQVKYVPQLTTTAI